jgi:hypothetical protein
MKRYMATLRPLISMQRLSVAATNLEGYDKVAGFSGIHLHDEYAELFFMNQCLGYAKGLSSTILFRRINEYAVPMKYSPVEVNLKSLLSEASSKAHIFKAHAILLPASRPGPLGDKTWMSGTCSTLYADLLLINYYWCRIRRLL